MKSIRIDNIEFRKYKSAIKSENIYEFVKWQKNDNYNRKQEFIDNGYALSFGEYYLVKDGKQIPIESFDYQEICWTISFLKKDSESWYLETVSDRLLDLKLSELTSFFDIYRKVNKKINKW